MSESKLWILLSIPAGAFAAAILTMYDLILGKDPFTDALGGFIGIVVAFLIIAIIYRK